MNILPFVNRQQKQILTAKRDVLLISLCITFCGSA